MNQITTMEVNLDVIHRNINHIISKKSGSFLFVLKANAYGHGYVTILKELEQYDKIVFIGVATPAEALYISAFTKKQIVILGYTQNHQLSKVVKKRIIPTIFEYHQASFIQEYTNVFVNIDTGFHRLGGEATDAFVQEIMAIQLLENINVLGVFTHLALNNVENDKRSIDLFEQLTNDLQIPYRSISDSIAYTRYDTNENLFRIGAAMFGLTSTKEHGKLSLQPSTALYTYVTHLQTMMEDAGVFYRSRVAAGTKLATIQIGYADGLFRTMPPGSYAMINSKPCPYVEVGMDQSIIDVSDVAVSVGDRVTIFDEEALPLGKLATWCKTNKNNILSMIGPRVVRAYKKQGKRVQKLDLEGVHNEE